MKIEKFKLDNGLRVVVVPIENLESATLTVWVKTGSRHENEKNAGVSHFLEHMVFKGGKKRPSTKKIAEAVDNIGAEFNAATYKEWTNFYIKARADNMRIAFDVLSDMVLDPILDAAEIEKEKGVILQELKMYEDNPRRHVWDIFQGIMFNGSTLGWETIGTKKSVSEMKREDFVEYRRNQYNASTMVLTIAGGVNVAEVKKLAQEYFSGLAKTSDYETFKTFGLSTSEKSVVLLTQKREQTNFVVGFPGVKIGHPDRFIISVLRSILSGGMSSRLFTQVRERRGLAYSVFADSEYFIDAGYFSAYAGVDPKKVKSAIKVILKELYKLTTDKHGITNAELKKAKEYLKGHIALGLEDSSAINDFVGMDELFMNEVFTPEQIYKEIDVVTIEDVVRVASELFQKDKVRLAIIGPHKSEAVFDKLLV